MLAQSAIIDQLMLQEGGMVSYINRKDLELFSMFNAIIDKAAPKDFIIKEFTEEDKKEVEFLLIKYYNLLENLKDFEREYRRHGLSTFRLDNLESSLEDKIFKLRYLMENNYSFVKLKI